MDLSPVGLAQRLVVGDLQTDPAPLNDPDHFIDGFEQKILFVAHMYHDDAVVLGDNLGQLDDLVRFAVASGRIDEPERETLCAFLHAPGQQFFHLFQFAGGGFAVVVAHDIHSNGAMPYETDKACGRMGLFRIFQIFPKAAPRIGTVQSSGQRRHIVRNFFD